MVFFGWSRLNNHNQHLAFFAKNTRNLLPFFWFKNSCVNKELFWGWSFINQLNGCKYYREPRLNSPQALFSIQTWAAYLGFLTLDIPQCGNLVIFLPLRFYVKLIWADIQKVKNCQFNNFEGFEFWFLEKFHTWKCQKFPKLQNSELLKWSKCQVLGLQNDQNWFLHKILVWEKSCNFHIVYSQVGCPGLYYENQFEIVANIIWPSTLFTRIISHNVFLCQVEKTFFQVRLCSAQNIL